MTPLIWFTISWSIGIMLARQLGLPWSLVGWAAIPVVVGLWLYRRDSHPRFWLLNGLWLLLGALRLGWATPTIDADHIAFYNETKFATMVGQIVAEPDIRDTYTNLQVEAETITLANGQPQSVHGLVLVRTARYPEYHYGDQLTLSGTLETPPIFTDFSYKDYLARKDIHAMLRRPRIEAVTPANGLSAYAAIFRWKAQASQVINGILPEPQAALLNGILLGIRSGIPRDLYEEFNKTGASHVIVISGSNVAIVVALLLLVGQRVVGKRYAALSAVVGVILYTILVGSDASVTRAAIMGIIYVGAIYFGRSNNILNALFAAALMMTIYNPLTLWDVGFQLSFMATLGLIVLVPLLEQSSSRLVSRGGVGQNIQSLTGLLREAVLVTVAAQIMVTPLLLYHFGRLSLVSLLTNLLIVPVQPLVMLFGGLATLGGFLFLAVGRVLGWLVWLPLTWTVTIVRWTAGFSWAEIQLPAFPLWLMVLLYLCLAIALWGWHRPDNNEGKQMMPSQVPFSRTTLFGVGGLALIAILTWSATKNLPDGKLHVAFLDIGQGDAIFITTPNGRQILVDGGPSAAQLGYRLGEEMPFWDRSIDIIINTHPDADHLGGLVEIVDRYAVEQVFISNVETQSALQQEWLTQLAARELTPILAWQHMTLQLDTDVQAVILNPGTASTYAESGNDQSVVLKLSMGEISFLLTGDIEAEVERALASNGLDLAATILKSPHHGSKTSSTSQFLEAVNPQLVVISAGSDNRFGHPHEVVLERYAAQEIDTLRTDELGTVEIMTDGVQIWVETVR